MIENGFCRDPVKMRSVSWLRPWETMSRKSSERTYTLSNEKGPSDRLELRSRRGQRRDQYLPSFSCGSSGGCRLAVPREVLFMKIRLEGQRLLKMQMENLPNNWIFISQQLSKALKASSCFQSTKIHARTCSPLNFSVVTVPQLVQQFFDFYLQGSLKGYVSIWGDLKESAA